MSIDGGFSWFVLFPLTMYTIIGCGIWLDNIWVKSFASLLVLVYGLNECFRYRWLD